MLGATGRAAPDPEGGSTIWAALATSARLRAAQTDVAPGRNDADAALDLATSHELPWSELDALRAHAALDEAENTDNGWSARADARTVGDGAQSVGSTLHRVREQTSADAATLGEDVGILRAAFDASHLSLCHPVLRAPRA